MHAYNINLARVSCFQNCHFFKPILKLNITVSPIQVSSLIITSYFGLEKPAITLKFFFFDGAKIELITCFA